SAIDRGDEGTAKTLATLLQELAPALKEPLQAYLEANNAGSRNCATTFLMLRFSRNAAVCTVGVRTSAADGQAGPGSRQLVVPGRACGRQSTRLRAGSVGADGAAARVVGGRRPRAQFRWADQRARAEREWSRLGAEGAPAGVSCRTNNRVGQRPRRRFARCG